MNVAGEALARRLWLSTALPAVLVLAGPARAQTVPPPPQSAATALPNASDVVSIANASVTGGTGTGTPTALTVDVGSRTAVIDWSHFNVPAGTTATFTKSAPDAKVAVLNRVVGDLDGGTRFKTPSDIGGTITGSAVEVWLSNTAGILFGPGGAIDVAGLVATTLDIDPTRFGGDQPLMLTSPTGGAGSITSLSTSPGQTVQIIARGGVLALIAPVVQVTGTFAARDEAVFVTASNVSMSQPGSLLSLTLNNGTTLGRANGTAQQVGGSVQAGSAYFLLSAQQMVNALLQVDASVTTAAGSNGTIVLGGAGSAGVATVAAGGANAGMADAVIAGALTSATSIGVTMSGGYAGTGALTAAGAVGLAAGGTLVQEGAVAADGAYSVRGAGVVLGGATAVDQRGAGVSVTATGGGTIADGSGGVRLNAGTGNLALLTSDAAITLTATGTALSGRNATISAGLAPVAIGALTLSGDAAITGESFAGAALLPSFTGMASSLSLTDTAGGLSLGSTTVPGTLTVINLGAAPLNVGGALTGSSGTVALTSASGIVLNAGLTAGTDVSLAGPVTLSADATLTSTGGGAVDLAGTVDGAFGLTTATSGISRFGAVVGGTTALASLTTGAATLGGGAVTTTGGQSYGGAVTLGGATRLASTGGGTIGFAGTLDGAYALTTDTTGTTRFGGAVGGVTAPASLSTGAGAVALDGGAVTTTGAQSYGGAATLGAATRLASTSGGAIGFVGTLDGAYGLTTDTAGVTRFGDVVGGATALATLNTGATALAGGAVTTTGAQGYGGAVTLEAATRLASTGGAVIDLGRTVDGFYALTTETAGTTRLGGVVGGTVALAALTVGAAALDGGAITTVGSQSYGGPTMLGAATRLASTGGGAIGFAGTVDGGFGLTTDTAGKTRFGGAVGQEVALASLTTGVGAVALDGGIVTTTGAQGYAGRVTLSTATRLASTGDAAVTFGAGVDGAAALAIDTGGDVTIGGMAGSEATPLSALTIARGGAVTLGTLRVDGAVALGQGTSLGSLAIMGPGTVGSLAATATGPVTMGDVVGATAVTLASDAGAVSFGTLSGAGTKMIVAASGITGAGVDGAGAVTLRTVAGTIGLGRFGVMAAPASLSADGGSAVTLGTAGVAGNVAGTLTIGGTVPPGSATLRGIVRAQQVSVTTAGGALTLGGMVETGGGQFYAGPVTLDAATRLASMGGAVIGFAGTVDGGYGLTTDTAGTTRFGGAVGGTTPLASLTTAMGTVALDGGAVTTVGAQRYGGPTTLGAATRLASTGGGVITFAGTLNGGYGLIADTTGLTRFGSPVTLASLAATGAVALDGGAVSTAGAQSYGGAATLGAATRLASANGGTIGFDGTVDGVFALAVDTAGTTRFGGAVGGTTALASLTVQRGVALQADAVTVSGAVRLGSISPLGTLVLTNSLIAGSLSANVSQSATVGTIAVTGTAMLAVRNGDLRAGRVSGAGVDLAAGGAVRIAGGMAGTGDYSVRARGEASVIGNVDAAGNYQVSGADVTLGGVQRATGAVTLTADGAIGGVPGLVLTSDGDNSGDLLTLGAARLLLDGALVRAGGAGRSAIRIVSGPDTSGALRFGTVTADRIDQVVGQALTPGLLTRAGDVRFDALSLGTAGATNTIVAGGSLTIAGPLMLGSDTSLSGASGLAVQGTSRSSGALTLRSAAGDVALGDAAVDGGLDAAAGGAITFGAVTGAGGRGFRAGGAIRGVAIDGAGTVVLAADGTGTAGGVIVTGGLGRNAAIGSLAIDAGGAVTIGAPDAQGVAISALGDVRIGRSVAPAALTINGDTVAGGALQLAAGDAALRNVTAGALALTTTGTLRADGALTGASVASTSGGDTSARLIRATAGDLRVRTGSALGGPDGTRTNLSSAGGIDLVVGANALLGTVEAAGAVSGTAASLNAFAITTTNLLLATEQDLAVATATVGSGAVLRAGGALTVSDRVTAGASIALTATTGDLRLGTATAGSGAVLRAGGALSVADQVAAGGAVTAVAGGLATIGTLSSANAGVTLDAGSATVRQVTARTDASLAANGDLAVMSVMAGGQASLRGGGSLAVGERVTAAGTVSAVAGGRATVGILSSTGADVTLSAGSATVREVSAATGASLAAREELALTAVAAGGDALLRAGTSLGVVGQVAANGSITATAGGDATIATLASRDADIALTAGSATVQRITAGRDATLRASGALTVADRVAAGGAVSVTTGGSAAVGTLSSANAGVLLSAGSATVQQVAARTAAMLTATAGDFGLRAATIGGDLLVDAAGLASLGTTSVAGSGGLTVRSSDVALDGSQSAPRITFVNRAAGRRDTMLGDGLGAGGFALSQAEIGLVQTPALVVDGGAGMTRVGTLALGAATGSRSVELLTSGRVEVSGALSAGDGARTVRLGGSATSSADRAAAITVVTTPSGGGKLLLAGADLELRAGRIAVGQAGLLSALGSGASDATARALVSNPASVLYNSLIGGATYATVRPTFLTARSLTVRYTDYALIQNGGPAGISAGVVLGSAASPSTPALVLDAGGRGNNAFALFGTINGIGDVAAALLGPRVIGAEPIDLTASRVNGCLIGSGAGCLTSTVAQPTINVFDASRLDLFRSAEDFALPFDPLVGSGNEALFSAITFDAPVAGAACINSTDDERCRPLGEKKP